MAYANLAYVTDELKRLWGANIEAGRKALGMRQEDLAAALNIRQSTVCRWEKGQMIPRDGMKARVAKALCQDVRQLFPLVRAA